MRVQRLPLHFEQLAQLFVAAVGVFHAARPAAAGSIRPSSAACGGRRPAGRGLPAACRAPARARGARRGPWTAPSPLSAFCASSRSLIASSASFSLLRGFALGLLRDLPGGVLGIDLAQPIEKLDDGKRQPGREHGSAKDKQDKCRLSDLSEYEKAGKSPNQSNSLHDWLPHGSSGRAEAAHQGRASPTRRARKAPAS